AVLARGAHRPPRSRDLEPGQALLPGARADEGRPRLLLPRPGRMRPPPPPPPAVPHEAVPERSRGRVLPPEAGPGNPPALRRRGAGPVSERALDRVRRRRQRRRAPLGRQPRL